jgi:ABC-type sugar transport system ATPase subunit
MALLKVSGISKSGEAGLVLHKIDFSLNEFQKIAIAGETGSGKSTLLKIIAGLVQPDTGEVYFNNELVKGPAAQLVPGHPSIAYLSQHFDLQKFLRVEQVLQYANSISAREAAAIYAVCRIDHLLQRKTDQLSGGEKQRIAIARLLISKPRLLLLDEPYSNLDMVVKSTLKSVINDIGKKLRITCMLVSHDPDDTLSWADEIIVLKEGKVVQQGVPESLYQHPINEYVAGLFGSYNILQPNLLKVLGIKGFPKGVLVRPEHFRITRKREHTGWRITEIRFHGNTHELTVANKQHTIHVSTTRTDFKPGDWVGITLRVPKK